MALMVATAFNKLRQTVDLGPEQTRLARRSLTFLTQRITTLSKNDPSFPKITGRYIPFGSFARKTKINPLDDIDVLMLLNDRGVKPSPYGWEADRQKVVVASPSAPLAVCADDDGNLNSIKILNRIKSEISRLHNYRYSALKRNKQAVTLRLKTQSWNFDLVPALPVIKSTNGTVVVSHYLIPNGTGGWMATDPRKNAADTTRVNVRQANLFLPTVRLIKYWNGRGGKPKLGSFYIETLATKIFATAPVMTSIPQAVEYFFRNCSPHLYSTCLSPTGHGKNLDADCDWATKHKVATAMAQAAKNASLALNCTDVGNTKHAFAHWRRVFGTGFSSYG